MAVPTYVQFIDPLLRFLAQHTDGLCARDVYDPVADALNVAAEDRALVLPSGQQQVYKNRIGWAKDRLRRHGLCDSPARGVWRITADGLAFAARHAQGLSTEELDRLATVPVVPAGGAAELAASSLESGVAADMVAASPDDRLDAALAELRSAAAAELLDTLGNVSPSRFETIVLDVLHRMGYGTNRGDLKRIGGVGDGGVDGVISLDRLGLEKVYVQAKRWHGTVGRPEIQAFYGALAGQHARKGVFITTSAYTAQAVEFARSVDGIVLVDGERLAHLMIDCEVGVTLRRVHVPRLDSDYFDEDV